MGPTATRAEIPASVVLWIRIRCERDETCERERSWTEMGFHFILFFFNFSCAAIGGLVGFQNCYLEGAERKRRDGHWLRVTGREGFILKCIVALHITPHLLLLSLRSGTEILPH